MDKLGINISSYVGLVRTAWQYETVQAIHESNVAVRDLSKKNARLVAENTRLTTEALASRQKSRNVYVRSLYGENAHLTAENERLVLAVARVTAQTRQVAEDSRVEFEELLDSRAQSEFEFWDKLYTLQTHQTERELGDLVVEVQGRVKKITSSDSEAKAILKIFSTVLDVPSRVYRALIAEHRRI